MTTAIAIVLAVLAATGLVLLVGPGPNLAGAGLTLAAGAPLAFVVHQRIRRPGGQRRHPVLFSTISGLGCVLVMAHVYRFGDEEQWVLIAAFSALVLWMVWQRWKYRRSTGPG